MQTPSHFLLTAVLNRQLAQREIPLASKALLIGSVLPDIPFFLLTVGFEIYYRWFVPLPVAGGIMEYLHFDLFFNDPLWIVSHNFFHSPIINSLLLLLGWRAFRRNWRWGLPLFWLAVGTQLHTFIDILTHYGLTIFFPGIVTIRGGRSVSTRVNLSYNLLCIY